MVSLVLLSALGLAATLSAANLDETTLMPKFNLVSNCSFEAADEAGKPKGWDLYAQPQHFSLADDALHGQKALVAAAPEGTTKHTAARQTCTAIEGQELVLSAWLKVRRTDGKLIRVYLEFQDENEQRLSIQPADWAGNLDKWTKLEVKAQAPPLTARAVALVPYLFGSADVLVDAVSLASADGSPVTRPEAVVSNLRTVLRRPDYLRLAWDSNADAHVIEWRSLRPKRRPWQRVENVREREYTIILLSPDTEYEVRVSIAQPDFWDEKGQKIFLVKPAMSQPLVESTKAWQPRIWAGFKLWPSVHLGTFPDGTLYPCIEAYEGAFYVLEVRDSELYLSRVIPEDLKPEWTKLVVEREPGCYQGIPDTCILHDKLWITWNRQATGRPDYDITQSRQFLTYWDLTTNERGPTVTLEPEKPGRGTWEGGLAVLGGQLWVMWMEVRLEGDRRRTQIVCAPYDMEVGLGERVVWQDCPTVYPYGPSLSSIDGELALLFSDLAALEKEPQQEPLLWVLFDGKTFHGLRWLRTLGRHRYAKGVQFGRSFLLAYKSNSRWLKWSYRFHDIALTKLGPGAGDASTIAYVDDMKYNSSPDVTLYKGQIYVVYNKFEHAYDDLKAPTKLYGTFIGRIEPEVGTGG